MPKSMKTAAINYLLKSIPPADFEAMYRHFEWIDLKSSDVLYAPSQSINYIYFPVSGICSVLARGSDGAGVETGLIGREGMIGASLCFGVADAPFEILVQVPGRSARIPDYRFIETFNASEGTRTVIQRYLYVALVQTAQTALANGRMTIQQRLARWILMCHDRLDTAELPITHEFLSKTLAVRRSGITVSLQILEEQRAIKSTRGKVKILDRALLEQIAGSAYGVAEREYQRLLFLPARHTELAS